MQVSSHDDSEKIVRLEYFFSLTRILLVDVLCYNRLRHHNESGEK